MYNHITAHKLLPNTQIPSRHSRDAAGCDIYTNTSGTVYAKQRGTLYTGISVHVPPNHMGLVYGRSGLSNKYLLEVYNNGVCFGEQKEVVVEVYNHGDVDFVHGVGERIAQIVFVEIDGDVDMVE